MHYIIREDIESVCKEELPWSKLKNKKILITGANGYLATYLVYSLIRLNDIYELNMQVFALCRNSDKAKKKFVEYMGRQDFCMVIQDVTNQIDDTYKADIIVHAASPASTYVWKQNPKSILDANIIGWTNVLECAKRWKCERVVLYSSSAVYGNETPQEGADEKYRTAIDFEDIDKCYYLSKQMCEMMAQVYVQQFDLDIVSLRPFNINGPGMGFSQRKCTTDFIKNYICGENIILRSQGTPIRDFCYLADTTKAFFYVLLKGEKGEAYNVCSEKGVCTIKELAEVFLTFDKKISIEFDIPKEANSFLHTKTLSTNGSSAKLQKLGWRDETTLREGVWRTICWAQDCDFMEL